MRTLVKFWREARKTVASLVGGTITWGYMVVASDQTSITAQEWLGLAVVVATALGVYQVTNKEQG